MFKMLHTAPSKGESLLRESYIFDPSQKERFCQLLVSMMSILNPANAWTILNKPIMYQ